MKAKSLSAKQVLVILRRMREDARILEQGYDGDRLSENFADSTLYQIVDAINWGIEDHKGLIDE